MKLNYVLIALFFIAVSITAKAQPSELDNTKVDVQLTQNKQIRIMYMNAANERVSFKIFDSDGQLIENRTYTADGHLKIGVKMNNLPDGKYDIKVYSDDKMMRQERVDVVKGKLTGMPKLIRSATIQYAMK